MKPAWLFLGVLALTTCTPARADMTVYAVDGLTRVRPDDAPRPGGTIMIRAARNEYEPFQVVVRAHDEKLTGVDVEITDFRSGDGVIPRANVTFYREHYVRITHSSPGAPEPVGWYPDALIPFVIPRGVKQIGKARFGGAPFDVEPGRNQPVWVDVYIPRDAQRGVYDATLTVTAEGRTSETILVRLSVWDLTLPDTPSMRSNFGKLGIDIANAYGVQMNSEEFRVPEWHYAVALAAHRISPIIPNTLYPRVGDDGSIDPSRTHDGLVRWIETFHVTGFPLRLLGDDPAGRDRRRNLTHLRAMMAYLEQHGWEEMAYVYVIDEPGSAADYEDVRQRAALVHEAVPTLKVMCTEQTRPEDPGFGTLVGSVDIWVPCWRWFDEATTVERQRAGEEVWSYTALTPSRGERLTPCWQLDYPLLDYRIPAWISWRYELTGLLYWSPTYWTVTPDMWTDPGTYRVDPWVFNGDGALMYPGVAAGINGPVTSIRLKQIREGFEDYEYLKLAEKGGYRKFAADTVREIARSWSDWDPRPQALYDARGALARHIVSGE